MEELTGRQKELLDFIVSFQDKHGFPPTLAQMAEQLKVSSLTGVRGHLAALERKGFISKNPGESRAVAVCGWKRRLNATIGRAQGRHNSARAVGSVTYRIGWFTKGRVSLLADAPVAATVERTIREISAEHGWTIQAFHVLPDRITLTITVSPDHAPAVVVQHFQWFAVWERFKQFGLSGLRELWAPGFAVGTDDDEFARAMDELGEELP